MKSPFKKEVDKQPQTPPILEEEEWTPAELAGFLKVASGTVYSWHSRGVEMPPHIHIGGTVRFRKAAVMQWIVEQEQARKKRNFEA